MGGANMNARALGVLVAAVVVVLIGANSVYIVKQFEKAILLEFGRVKLADIPPGLHFKYPIINEVKKFNGKVLTSDASPERFLTVEKKSMIVDSFTKWRVADVGRYYTATNGNEEVAARLIAQRVNEGLRNEFGERTLQEVVSGERDELMTSLIRNLNEFSGSSLGIEVVDVRVKKIELPDDVKGSVYDRMTAEREQEAQEHRSKGNEQAEVIKADADRQRIIIAAEAYRDAEKIKGEGDAEAAAVYAAAYNRDPEFYSFVRSLEAYKNTFSSRGDVLLVDPDSDFFRYLNDSQGKK